MFLNDICKLLKCVIAHKNTNIDYITKPFISFFSYANYNNKNDVVYHYCNLGVFENCCLKSFVHRYILWTSRKGQYISLFCLVDLFKCLPSKYSQFKNPRITYIHKSISLTVCALFPQVKASN